MSSLYQPITSSLYSLNQNKLKFSVVALTAALLTACGGGGGSSSGGATTNTQSELVETDSTAELTQQSSGAVSTDTVTTPVTATSTTTTTSTTNQITSDNVALSTSEMAVYNQLNIRRTSCGFGGLGTDIELQKAADNHANYLLYMNKYTTKPFEGHGEFDSTNPFYTGLGVADRVQTGSNKGAQAQAVNYAYQALTENLSFLSFNQAYLDQTTDVDIALGSIKGLLAAPYHMATLLSPNYAEMGVSYGRDTLKTPITLSDGSTDLGYGSVLEMVMGTPQGSELNTVNGVVSYPCDGVKDTQYELTHESPNPFGSKEVRDLSVNPIGQPVYIYANDAITVTNAVMKDSAGVSIKLIQLNQQNDPNKILSNNQVILMPDVALKPSQSYSVSYDVTLNGVKERKNLFFTTIAK